MEIFNKIRFQTKVQSKIFRQKGYLLWPSMTFESILHKIKFCLHIVSIQIKFYQNRFINEWSIENIAKIAKKLHKTTKQFILNKCRKNKDDQINIILNQFSPSLYSAQEYYKFTPLSQC